MTATSTAEDPMTRAWSDEELATLARFRRRIGRRWKSKLFDLYASGMDAAEPEGSSLRRIRNRQGPSRIDALKASTLDEAEARLIPAGEPQP